MISNQAFFKEFWPRVAVAVTRSRPQSDSDTLPLLRWLRIRRGARVLDVPCGFGRHAVLLARRSYRVTGVKLDLRRGDMRRLPFRGKFDLLLNLFTSFGYFGDAGDQQVLRGFYRALRPGAWLALQMAHRDWIVRNYRPRRRERIGGGIVLKETGSLNLATGLMRTVWIARRGRSTWRGTTNLRLYSCHELVRMLRAAGFTRISALGSFTGAPLTFDHQWQLIVGQKTKG